MNPRKYEVHGNVSEAEPLPDDVSDSEKPTSDNGEFRKEPQNKNLDQDQRD